MFNKNDNNKGISLIQGKLYQTNDILVSKTFISMMDEYHKEKELNEKNDYQNEITSYINRKHENNIKKQYNPKIVNLYKNGVLTLNNEEYLLKDFYIVFDDNKNDFHLKAKDSKFNKEIYDYNKAVKFIDTTAFIELINSSEVNDNKIILNDINLLNKVISNWNGYIHSEVAETDSIINKKMIKDDNNG